MEIQQITLTPEVAAEFLRVNTSNRPLNKSHVKELGRDMKEGRWKSNGDTICRNGTRMIDGQHRCHAVIETGISIPAIVVSGLADDVFDTKDCGKRRGAADVLATRGEKYYAALAASLQVIDRYMKGMLANKGVRYSNSEIELLLEKYPEARESAAFSVKVGTKRLVPNSLMIGLHYLMSQFDRDAANEFWTMLIAGSNLDSDSPIFLLRERLVANTVAKARLRTPYIAALTIKAWNAWRSGKTVKTLRWSESGKTKEGFPMLSR